MFEDYEIQMEQAKILRGVSMTVGMDTAKKLFNKSSGVLTQELANKAEQCDEYLVKLNEFYSS